MKTLELEIVQGFFFYPHYAFRYIFVKLDFANSVAFFKAFEKAIKIPFFSGSNCLLYPGFDSFFLSRWEIPNF